MTAKRLRLCDDCGGVYYSNLSTARYCSYTCNQHVNEGVDKARKLGLPGAPVGRFTIFTRDRWICYLCGWSTRYKLGRDALSPSMDHVVPFSSPNCPGHIASNLRTTHMTCNKRKADRPFMEGDQAWYQKMLTSTRR